MSEKTGQMERFLKPITDKARVETVYGEPERMAGRTVIPVARVMLMIGGGFGMGDDEPGTEMSEGGGGGAFVFARPLGALEITPQETRFIHFKSWWQKLIPILAGLSAGLLIARLLLKQKK